MAKLEKHFIVAYCGVSIKVTPIIDGPHIQYLVKLPTRQVVLEKSKNDQCWVEASRGMTTISNEIGAMIQNRDIGHYY